MLSQMFKVGRPVMLAQNKNIVAFNTYRYFSGCSDFKGPQNISELMMSKLKPVFNDEFDHVDVKNPDGNGQQVVIYIISDQFKGMLPV